MKNTYYSYDITKVINVVLFIIHSFGNRIHLLLLQKLLYSADMLHLARYGFLITRDKYIFSQNDLLPVNTYFLYNKLVEDNAWFSLQYNIHEFFYVKGNYVYCHQVYNGNVLSGSEVSCLFETIHGYKKQRKAFLATVPNGKLSNGNTLYNELMLLDDSAANEGVYNYIRFNLKTNIFETNSQWQNLKGPNKLSVLGGIAIGTVLAIQHADSIYIVAGVSLMQYMLVQVITTDMLVLENLFYDLQKSILKLRQSYGFLPGAFYVNCSQVHCLSHDQLYKYLLSDASMQLGNIDAADMEVIVTTLHASATITANIKEELVAYV